MAIKIELSENLTQNFPPMMLNSSNKILCIIKSLRTDVLFIISRATSQLKNQIHQKPNPVSFMNYK